MVIAGLDPSLTSFGAARVSSDPGRAPELFRWRPGDKLRGHLRLDFLLKNVRSLAAVCDLVLVEGAAVSRVQGGEAHLNLAGLHWLVRHELWLAGIPYAVVQPAVRGKYITGKGNASKEDCLLAVERRFPEAGVKGTDDADAFTLAAMGADYHGFALARVPELQRSVLTAVTTTGKGPRRVTRPVIDWPETRRVA